MDEHNIEIKNIVVSVRAGVTPDEVVNDSEISVFIEPVRSGRFAENLSL